MLILLPLSRFFCFHLKSATFPVTIVQYVLTEQAKTKTETKRNTYFVSYIYLKFVPTEDVLHRKQVSNILQVFVLLLYRFTKVNSVNRTTSLHLWVIFILPACLYIFLYRNTSFLVDFAFQPLSPLNVIFFFPYFLFLRSIFPSLCSSSCTCPSIRSDPSSSSSSMCFHFEFPLSLLNACAVIFCYFLREMLSALPPMLTSKELLIGFPTMHRAHSWVACWQNVLVVKATNHQWWQASCVHNSVPISHTYVIFTFHYHDACTHAHMHRHMCLCHVSSLCLCNTCCINYSEIFNL